MIMTFKHLLAAAIVTAPIAALPGVAHADEAAAEEQAAGPFEISGEIGAFSDYRFRGISLSGKDPEVTAELTLEHESGLYASAWFSNVDLGSGANDLEMDYTLGYSRDIGAVNVDVGAIYYAYGGHSSFNYVEAFGSVGTNVGPAEVRVGVAYAPKQDNLGGNDNTYVYVSGDVPLGKGPLSLHGTFGYENGAFAFHKKDWLIGLSLDLGNGFTATADYVDTAHSFTPLGSATAVVSLTKSF